MIYYKVTDILAGSPAFGFHRGGGTQIIGQYVKNELYTGKELRKHLVNLHDFEKVEIKKSNIYFSFGCRFEMEV